MTGIPKMVFVNSCFREDLSTLGDLSQEIIISDFHSALKNHAALLKPYDYSPVEEGFIEQGAFIYFPKGKRITETIHLAFITEGESPVRVSPKNLIILESGAEASLIESYESSTTTHVTKERMHIHLGENTGLTLTRVQEEGNLAVHESLIEAHIERAARMTLNSLLFGSKESKIDIHVTLDGLGADCTLNGLYVGQGSQKLNHQVRLDHLKPHGTSNQIFKGILDGSSKGEVRTLVTVYEGAIKTNAHQKINNLLLSDTASANPEPQLKIFNDDVQCTHGATVGQLEAQALFYLRARGLSEAEARSLLIYAFADEIIAQLRTEDLQKKVKEMVKKKLSHGEGDY